MHEPGATAVAPRWNGGIGHVDAELVEQPGERAVQGQVSRNVGRVAGVDLLEGKKGPILMEVNSSPGLEGIESCTELDVAGAIVDYIAAQVDFPEIDIRQRLTVSKGYRVSEIYIPEGSDFVGKALKDSFSAEADINVLTLYRGGKVIPNPRTERVLEADIDEVTDEEMAQLNIDVQGTRFEGILSKSREGADVLAGAVSGLGVSDLVTMKARYDVSAAAFGKAIGQEGIKFAAGKGGGPGALAMLTGAMAMAEGDERTALIDQALVLQMQSGTSAATAEKMRAVAMAGGAGIVSAARAVSPKDPV